MRLYEIIDEYKHLEDALFESGGEETPEIQELMAVNKDTFLEKLESFAKVIANLEGDIEACEAEMHRLNNLSYSKRRAIDAIRARILYALQEMGDCDKKGVFRAETPLFKFSTRKSEQVVVDPDKIPKSFLTERVTYTPDKAKIKQEIKAGKEINGAYISTNLNLQIR